MDNGSEKKSGEKDNSFSVYAKKAGAFLASSGKKALGFLKENKTFDVAAVYAAAVLVLILVSVLGMQQPVVPVCLALMIEAGIAILLHNVELWLHAAAVAIELVCGMLIGRTGLMVLCIVLYAITIAALQVLDKVQKPADAPLSE